MVPKFYQHVLALAFAVQEINKNPNILPNVTLGFHIYDSYYVAKMTYRTTLDLLFKFHHFLPNYNCGTQNHIMGVIGGLSSDTSSKIADILHLFKIPQVTLQYKGIIQLLLHFKWKWIGLMTLDDENGEHFLETINLLLSRNGICSAFTNKVPRYVIVLQLSEMNKYIMESIPVFRDTTANAVVVYGETATIRWLLPVIRSSGKRDVFIQDFWEQSFDCFLPKSSNGTCTGEEMLENLPAPLFQMSITGHSYNIYNAVFAVAHAIHYIFSTRTKYGRNKRAKLTLWNLHSLLQTISFNNSVNDEIMFNENGELASGFDITNLITFPNKSYIKIKVGSLDPKAHSRKVGIGFMFMLSRKMQVPPFSLCNEPCYPGYSQKKKEGEKFCCYDCAACPEDSISDQEASVLGIFINQRDTPIVKANNQKLTYLLLSSLMLCFLCSLLFIGKPNKATCLLRQTAFGIIFSIAVSSILAKTITVVVAFMASKAGNIFRKSLGKRLGDFIVLYCSLVQVVICIVWLVSSPPFPDLDMHSVPGEVVVKCEEGSVLMFYCVLGYTGFLATVSFIVAFLARKLPDSFNEARFITFSMLVFCSVWISFIPTYLSTKGKYMVAVEIFSILCSGLGLLGCIFFPKCYIILLRPDLNKKEQIIRRKQ
uniref:G-protein coupled receptors family 3 profile domain-containing protein n=1 Tax=Salvator merianae TaxID=96440 RepID=A0A8D0DJY0_SALMN